jgi:hypothetical protein
MATPASTIFDHAANTGFEGHNDQPVTLGVGFKPTVDGNITAIFFYRPSQLVTDGTTSVALYGNDGTQLAVATGVSNGAAGSWVRCALPTPVAVTAGTTYVAAAWFNYSNGWYPATGSYFANSDHVGPDGNLVGLSSPNLGPPAGNGRFTYDSAASGISYPDKSFNDTNYWIDVELTTASSGTSGQSSQSLTIGQTASAAARVTAQADQSLQIVSDASAEVKWPDVGANASNAMTIGQDASVTFKVIGFGSSDVIIGQTSRWTFRVVGRADGQLVIGQNANGARSDSTVPVVDIVHIPPEPLTVQVFAEDLVLNLDAQDLVVRVPAQQ